MISLPTYRIVEVNHVSGINRLLMEGSMMTYDCAVEKAKEETAETGIQHYAALMRAGSIVCTVS